MENLQEQNVQFPLIGTKAPEFIAQTTQGNIHFPNDFSGKWIILFSHPADFTPIYTTEFMTFASMHEGIFPLSQSNEKGKSLGGVG